MSICQHFSKKGDFRTFLSEKIDVFTPFPLSNYQNDNRLRKNDKRSTQNDKQYAQVDQASYQNDNTSYQNDKSPVIKLINRNYNI